VRIFCATLLLIGIVDCAGAAGEPAVSTPAVREATLAMVDRLAADKSAVADAGVGKDPFYPSAGDLSDAVAKTGSGVDGLSDKERVELLADEIKPTGSVELGGEPQLLFTEKRQKIGDKLTVSIDKVEYVIEIVSIDKNRFRIRYNNVETTRSIK
jgi:hypothetical protein